MNFPIRDADFHAVFYVLYFACCAALIFLLGRIFHRSGAVFLKDAFDGNDSLIQAVTHLLDVGFYLMALGYAGASFRVYEQMNGYGSVAQIAAEKLGWFLLLMGVSHMFNLLLLALFRRRGAASPPHAAAEA